MLGIAQHLEPIAAFVSNFPSHRWGNSSYVYRLVGLLRSWQRGSWLLQWANPIGFALVSLVFALAPFVSTSLIGVLLLACAGFWALLTISGTGTNKSGSKPFGPAPIPFVVLLYWGIALVATAFSPVKEAALQGWVKFSLYLVFFALMARLLRSQRFRNWLILLYLHISLIVSVYGVQQWRMGVQPLATWNDPDSTLAKVTRVYSYLGNPNLLAGYLIAAVVFSAAAFFVWRSWVAKALALTMFGINAACMAFTWSRGGWLGLVAAGGVFLLLVLWWWSARLPRFWQTWLLPICLGTMAAGLVAVVIVVDPLRDRVTSIFAGRGDSSNNFRINVWLAVLEMIRDRPVLGIGPGNDAFNLIYPLYGGARYSALSAYSIFLEVAVEVGVIGLGCFLWLIATLGGQGWLQLQRLRRRGNSQGFWLIAALATVVGMLVHGLVDTVWYRPQISTVWWLMVALVASFYIPPGQGQSVTNE